MHILHSLSRLFGSDRQMPCTRSVLTLLALALAVAAVASAETVSFYSGLVNTQAIRSINLQTHLEENVFTWSVANSGDKGADFYLLAVSSDKAPHLALVAARVAGDKKKDAKEDELKTTRVEVTGAQVHPPPCRLPALASLPS